MGELLRKYRPVGHRGDLLSAVNVAKLCGVSRFTVYRWASTGKLRKLLIDGQMRFKRTDVDKLLARRG